MKFTQRKLSTALIALLFSGLVLLAGCEEIDDTGEPMDDQQQN